MEQVKYIYIYITISLTITRYLIVAVELPLLSIL